MALKKKELEKFKKLLLEKKAKIVQHLEDLSNSSESGIEAGMSGDQADIAYIEMNQASMHKIGRREANLVKKINRALRKIEEKEYGECEECGEEISIPRLEARPETELCIDCKTEQESKERKFSSEVEESDDDLEFSELEES